MREALREFNIDWRLWSAFKGAKGSLSGTDKEIDTLLSFFPQFLREKKENVDLAGPANDVVTAANEDYMRNILDAHAQGKKLALVTYNFSPAILFAMDIVPICLEIMSGMISLVIGRGANEFMDYCTQVGFPETGCSGQRVGLGPILAGLTESPDMVLYSTCGVCDSNAAAYAFAAEYMNVPAFQINYPPTLLAEETVEYQREDFRSMLAFLEDLAGHKVDPDMLRHVCELLNEQDRMLSELQDLQRLVPNPVPSIHNIFIYAAKLMYGGSPWGVEILKPMLAMARENAANGTAGNGRENVRGLWCYIDHYCDDSKYFAELAEYGVSHVGSMMTDFWQPGAPIAAEGRQAETYDVIDTTSLETMLDGLAAQTSRLPMIKQIRGPYDAPHMWLDDTLGAARIFKADFLVFMGTMGCRNTWGMVKPFAREAEKAGFPTFLSYSDSFDKRVESVETVIDNTLEFLRVRGLLD